MIGYLYASGVLEPFMMTKERVIVSAYTGVRMCDMSLIEEYVQEKLGRPICSNEWGDQRFHEIIQAMVAEDFLMLCE